MCSECEIYGEPPEVTLQYSLSLTNQRIHGSTLLAECQSVSNVSVVVTFVPKATLRLPPVGSNDVKSVTSDLHDIILESNISIHKTKLKTTNSETEDLSSPHIIVQNCAPEEVCTFIRHVQSEYSVFDYEVPIDSKITK